MCRTLWNQLWGMPPHCHATACLHPELFLEGSSDTAGIYLALSAILTVSVLLLLRSFIGALLKDLRSFRELMRWCPSPLNLETQSDPQTTPQSHGAGSSVFLRLRMWMPFFLTFLFESCLSTKVKCSLRNKMGNLKRTVGRYITPGKDHDWVFNRQCKYKWKTPGNKYKREFSLNTELFPDESEIRNIQKSNFPFILVSFII